MVRVVGKVYLVYCPNNVAWAAFRNNGLFLVESFDISTDGTPSTDLEFVRELTTKSLDRGDLIFCKHASGDGEGGDEVDPKVMMAALSNLLQTEIPPHEYTVNADRIGNLAFQPLQKGEMLLLFQPLHDADDVMRSLMPVTTNITVGKSEEDEPLPLAKPASISGFEVIAIFCCGMNCEQINHPAAKRSGYEGSMG